MIVSNIASIHQYEDRVTLVLDRKYKYIGSRLTDGELNMLLALYDFMMEQHIQRICEGEKDG